MKIQDNILSNVENIDIKNGTITIPNSVTSIGDCTFNSCTSLTSITYKNKVHKVKCIDGYCMKVLSQRQHNDYTAYKCLYFGTDTKSIVVEKDGFYAHGDNLNNAIRDLEYKLCKDRGIEQYKKFNT